MKVLTNMALYLRFGFHRRAVADLLDAGDDQRSPGFQAALHDVVVADDLADLHRTLPRDEALSRRLGDEAEILCR